MRTGRGLREGTVADMVRQFAAAHGTITKLQVRQSLGLGVDQSARAVDTLLRRGFLSRLRHGVYAFVSDRSAGESSGRSADMEDRIRRAMQINERWSVAEIAQQAGTTESYVYKRLQAYRKADWVRQCGVRQKPNQCVEKLWRLTLKGRDALFASAAQESFRPDPVVMMAVELNRLVCSGMAQHVEEHREEALRLCRDLMGVLSVGGEAAADREDPHGSLDGDGMGGEDEDA